MMDKVQVNNYIHKFQDHKLLSAYYDFLVAESDGGGVFSVSAGYVALNLPLNLYQFNNKAGKLKFLPYFTVRDGATFAASFFYLNREPISPDHLYFVSSEVFAIAPMAWKKQMLLYRSVSSAFSDSRMFLAKRKINSLFLYVNYSIDFLPLSDNLLALKKILMKNGIKQIYIVIDQYNILIRDRAVESIYNFKLTKKILEACGKRDVEIITPSEFLKNEQLKDSYYIDFNESNVLYEDSYLTFHAYREGASVYKLKEDSSFLSKKEITSFTVSPYHSVSIFRPSQKLLRSSNVDSKIYKQKNTPGPLLVRKCLKEIL